MRTLRSRLSRVSFTTKDGRSLVIRPIKESDAVLLQDLHRRHSPETRRMRFFSSMPELGGKMAGRFSHVDFDQRAAFVACLEGEEAIRAVARYDAVDDDTVEVAFVIEDTLQGQGLGSELFRVLAAHAASRGFHTLTALTLADNRPMLRVFEQNADILEITRDGPALLLTMRPRIGLASASAAVAPASRRVNSSHAAARYPLRTKENPGPC